MHCHCSCSAQAWSYYAHALLRAAHACSCAAQPLGWAKPGWLWLHELQSIFVLGPDSGNPPNPTIWVINEMHHLETGKSKNKDRMREAKKKNDAGRTRTCAPEGNRFLVCRFNLTSVNIAAFCCGDANLPLSHSAILIIKGWWDILYFIITDAD